MAVPPARRARTIRSVAAASSVAMLAAVIWIDIRTGFWQEVVILSGIAAGLVTFLLTALFLERALDRAEHARWVPVTRLAITDLLLILSHQDSHLGRREIVPRRLELSRASTDGSDRSEVEVLRDLIIAERDDLTRGIARWASFLAASADVQTLLDHLAALAVHLDDVRDAVVDLERGDDGAREELEGAVEIYNDRIEQAIEELRSILDALESDLD